MSLQREGKSRRDRFTILREQIASFKMENETLKQSEKRLQDAQEQLRSLNNDLVHRIKLETDKRLPFNQAFETFQAKLEVEKQKELTLLALRRIVSTTSNILHFQSKKEAPQSISCESVLTSSIASIKDDVSGKDSGLDINEVQGLKDENEELKLENAKLHSEQHSMEKTIEIQRATIEEREEDLKVARQKWKMFEDHSSLLALHAHELTERKEMMEDELEFMAKELEGIKASHTEVIKRLEEKHARDRRRVANQVKKAEEVAAVFKTNNAKLKEELQERDLDNQANDIVGAAIMKGLQKNVNEDMDKFLTENKRLVDEMALYKTQIVDQESKLLESLKMLQETEDKCKMYEKKESLLLSQLDEISKEKKALEDELALKKQKIQFMETISIEQIKKLVEETQDKMLKSVLRNDLLEEGSSTYRSSQNKMEKKLQEKEMLLKSKQSEYDAIIGEMNTNYEAETMRYQEEIKELQTKIKEGEDKCNSLVEKESMLDFQLLDAKRQLIDLKDRYNTKVEELILENSNAHIKFLDEQTEKVRNSNAFKVKLRWVMEKCCKLEEANTEWEAKAEKLQLELNSKEEKIKVLDEQLTYVYERLGAKDIAIEQLSMKKSRRRGIRKLLCC